MKAEANEETETSSPSTLASGAVTPATEISAGADGETIVEEETPATYPTTATTASSSGSASPQPSTSSNKPLSTPQVDNSKAKKDGKKDSIPAMATAATKEEKKKTQNTVGKVTNLISTDMTNILEGRDFLIPMIHCPLQVIICVSFLYGILGYA